MSTTAKLAWLRVLRNLGVKHFSTTSSLGHPFVCHVGDLAGEGPFYNHASYRSELTVMAAWCQGATRPLIFDVGANLGFVSTQLVQMLRNRQPRVVAFEPVWSSFQKLRHSVQALKLEDFVTPVCCAISDRAGFVSIAFDERQSVFAQVRPDTTNARVGRNSSLVAAQTLDTFLEAFSSQPTLLKVDVEGFEAHVFRGARNLLSGPDAPAIVFELNPLTLQEVGSSASAVVEALCGYSFFYIDDFEGQVKRFGQPIENVASLEHACNLLAVPQHSAATSRWLKCRDLLSSQISATSGRQH